MIEFTKAYACGKEVFATLEAAQSHEIKLIFEDFCGKAVDPSQDIDAIPESIAKRILENQDAILDILTTTATSKPKARSIHGGKKIRKSKPEAELPLEK